MVVRRLLVSLAVFLAALQVQVSLPETKEGGDSTELAFIKLGSSEAEARFRRKKKKKRTVKKKAKRTVKKKAKRTVKKAAPKAKKAAPKAKKVAPKAMSAPLKADSWMVSSNTGPAKTTATPLVDTQAIIKQVSMCKVANAFIKATCACKVLGEQILPMITPLEISGLRASQTLINLDTGNWISKARSWINKGLDWLGVPDRYRIPKKIGYDIGIWMKLSKFKISLPKDMKGFAPEFDATISVKLTVLSKGPLKGKTFSATGRAKGRVYVTVAPYGKDCDGGKIDWTMMVLNMELLKVDINRIPNWIDGSSLFIKLLNWGLSKAYDDYPKYNTRGIGVCLKGNCPLATQPPKKEAKPILKIGGAKGQNKYIAVQLDKKGGVKSIKFKDHTLFCGVIDKIVSSGCSDRFVSAMAKALLPIKVAVPEHLAGKGLAVSADSFSMDIKNKTNVGLKASASLSKTGQRSKFTASLSVKLELKPVCDKKSFLLYVRPTIRGVTLSKPPGWLTNDVAVAAVNGRLENMDFCFPTPKIPVIGKRVNVCKMVDALFKEKCTGPFIGAVAGSLFPLTVRPGQLDLLKDKTLKALLGGIKLTVEKVGVKFSGSNNKNVELSVKISIKKDGQSAALTTSAKAGIGLKSKCGKDNSVVRINPQLKGLNISKIPDWLLKATVVDLANRTIGNWQALCVMGDCKKKQKINVNFPFSSLTTGAKTKSTCSFDTFKEGGAK